MKLYNGKYPIPDDSEYVVDFQYDIIGGENFYYQLVRLKDDAILCSYKSKITVMAYCWQVGITKEKVAFI